MRMFRKIVELFKGVDRQKGNEKGGVQMKEE